MSKKTILALIFLTYGLLSHADMVWIANKDVGVDSLKKVEVMKMLTGRSNKWSNGKPVSLVCLVRGDAENTFLRSYCGKSTKQFMNFWKKRAFIGKGTLPKEFQDDASVIDFVSKTSGALGFVDASTVSGQVAQIEIN